MDSVHNESISEDKFNKWLRNSLPGDKLTYYKGFNLADSITTSLLARKIKQVSYHYAVVGEVYLVQKKIPFDMYEYIAIRASNPPIFRLLPYSEYKVDEDDRPKNYVKHLVRVN